MKKYSKFFARPTADGVRVQSAVVTDMEFRDIAYGNRNESVGDLNWDGATSWEHAQRIQDEGFIPPAGALKIAAVASDENDIYMQHAQVGAVPDVAAYLMGVPECMIEMVHTAEAKPTIRLSCQLNVTAGIRATDQQSHAMEMYKAVRALQAAGYQVTLHGLFYNMMYGCIECLEVELLREGQVLSQATMGAKFHISYYRCGWFSWANTHYNCCGGSINPPQWIDNRMVIPSVEFFKQDRKEGYMGRYVEARILAARAEGKL